MIRRKAVSFSDSQQNITSDGDIERNGQVVRFQMSWPFPKSSPVQSLTGQPTADVATVAYNSDHRIDAVRVIADASVIDYSPRIKVVE